MRTNYGASLSPDATAFAHLIDDGGYPRAVQRSFGIGAPGGTSRLRGTHRGMSNCPLRARYCG